MTILRSAVQITTVARREIHEKRAILGVAVALGAVPLAASAWAAGVDAGTAGVVELLVAQLLAALVGLGLFGPDLASGRLGWYFSRPLSGFAIWCGKVGGAAVLAVVVTLIMALPALLLADPRAGRFGALPLGAAGLVVCPLLFVGAGAVGGVMARSRSRWLILDLVCVATLAAVVVCASERLHAATRASSGHHELSEPVFYFIVTSAFILASAAGILVGRVDVRRAHAVTSTTLWGLLVPAGAVLFGYTLSVLP